MIGFMVAPESNPNRAELRKRMRETYAAMHPEPGFVLAAILLPIVISIAIQLISAWITKWILNHTSGQVREMRTQAFDWLAASSPESMARLTSTSSPRAKQITP